MAVASLFTNIFRRPDPIGDQGKQIYADALRASKDPVWYTNYQIADDFIHRFDVLLYCLYPAIHHGDQPLNQVIFDTCFTDLDESVRIAGVGDMSLRKYMKKLMMAFNGRMRAYDHAMPDQDALTSVILRNIYDGEKGKHELARSLADHLIQVVNYGPVLLNNDSDDIKYNNLILSHVR